MARKNKADSYSYTRTAMIRGREAQGRYAVVQKDRDQARVVRRLADGTAPGPGELVRSTDVFDLKPTHVVPLGQRGTITLPGEMRRQLGLEEGTPLEIVQEDDGRLSIRPLSRIPAPGSGLELKELLDQITPTNLPDEVSTGESVSREAW